MQCLFFAWCEVVGLPKLKTVFEFWFWCKNICRIETWLWILRLLRFNIIGFGCKTKMDYPIDEVTWFWPIGFIKGMFWVSFGHVFVVGFLSAWERTLSCICNFVFIGLVLPSWGSLSLTVDNWLVDVVYCKWTVVDEMWVYLEFDLKHEWRVLLVLELRLNVWFNGDQGWYTFLNLKLFILPKYI